MNKKIFGRKFLAQMLNREVLAKEKIKELNENDPLDSLKNNTQKVGEIQFGTNDETENNSSNNIEKTIQEIENIEEEQDLNLQKHLQKFNLDKEMLDKMNDSQLDDFILEHLKNKKADFDFFTKQNEVQKEATQEINDQKAEQKAIELSKQPITIQSLSQSDLFNKIELEHKLNLEDKNYEKDMQKQPKKSSIEKLSKKDIQNTKKEKISAHYEGHRQRLRDKILDNGATSLKDYELLEILLTYSIPRADTKPLAKNLLEHFKNFQNIFLSDKAKLKKVKGLGESSICFLSIIHEITCRMAREEIIDQILLNTPEKVINYCRLRMSGLSYEQFYVLFLNRKNKLILDEPIQSGTIDKAAIFPRELVKRAIDLGAGAMILIHNHPSGDPTPSKADIETTINIQKAANLMEIFLYDHIIIGKNTHYSMRSNKIL